MHRFLIRVVLALVLGILCGLIAYHGVLGAMQALIEDVRSL